MSPTRPMPPPIDPSRRVFLRAAAGAGLAISAGLPSAAAALAHPARAGGAGLKILILGGTGFLGPACVDAALARGHTLTLFNRGRTEDRRQRAGRPSAVPEGVEVLYGNRDPEKTADSDDNEQAGDRPVADSPKGLTSLEGRSWDAVIDTSGYFPRMARASATLLAPRVSQYLFISTLSVYADNSKPGLDESDTLATLADPAVETFGSNFENYGGGKALCEAEVQKALPGRATILRPGYIVGLRDTSARFLYWPLRASRGGGMIVPGSRDDPVQIIDVRDLAEFIVLCLERRLMGVYNTTGPAAPLTMRDMVAGCVAGTGSAATPHWIPTEFLLKHAIAGEQFPIWLPPEGETLGFHRRSVAKAVAAGLKFRTVDDTARSTMEWWRSLPEDLQTRVSPPMLDPAREDDVIAAWKADQGG